MLLAASGAVFAGGAGRVLVRQRRFARRAARARGEVVDYRSETIESTDDGGSTRRTEVFYPIVQFRDAAGNDRRAETGSASVPPSHALGAAVTVLYDPADPARAEIDAVRALWDAPVWMLAFGLVQLGVAALLLVAGVRPF